MAHCTEIQKNTPGVVAPLTQQPEAEAGGLQGGEGGCALRASFRPAPGCKPSPTRLCKFPVHTRSRPVPRVSQTGGQQACRARAPARSAPSTRPLPLPRAAPGKPSPPRHWRTKARSPRGPRATATQDARGGIRARSPGPAGRLLQAWVGGRADAVSGGLRVPQQSPCPLASRSRSRLLLLLVPRPCEPLCTAGGSGRGREEGGPASCQHPRLAIG